MKPFTIFSVVRSWAWLTVVGVTCAWRGGLQRYYT